MKPPSKILKSVCDSVQQNGKRSLPFHLRGIKIDSKLIEATLTILNNCPTNALPQNCRNDIRERTPDGLDRRIKDCLGSDLRTANIISDVLADAGVVEIVKLRNSETGRLVKNTRLLEEWRWECAKEGRVNLVAAKQARIIQPRKEADKIMEKPDLDCQERDKYLNSRQVQAFIGWLESSLDSPGGFQHQYYLKKCRQHWQCDSLYEAYENYWWPYNMECPVHARQLKGSGFDDSFNYLTELAIVFRSSIQDGNVELTQKCALAMLKWGGVKNANYDKVVSMGNGVCHYFMHVQKRLNTTDVWLGNHDGVIMNSGFTKLYFLLINHFVMYDGRVGAALGLLSRLFSEKHGLNKIPQEINFSFGSGKEAGKKNNAENRRDPSKEEYIFPEFTGNSKLHLNDNIKASWLLKELADRTNSRFALLSQDSPLNKRLTAIQSALFMIGYDVSSYGNKGGGCPC